MLDPEAAEAAFLAANPGPAAEAIAVTCDKRYLREVRICLTKDLTFRSCPEIDRRGCRLARVGHAAGPRRLTFPVIEGSTP